MPRVLLLRTGIEAGDQENVALTGLHPLLQDARLDRQGF